MPNPRLSNEFVESHQLMSDPTSPSLARQLVRNICNQAGVSKEVLDTALLLSSEIVTNAIVHGHSSPFLRMVASTSRLRIEVGDHDKHLPDQAELNVYSTDGRGIMIVDSLSDAWGVEVEPEGRGKYVWFELSVTTHHMTEGKEVTTSSEATAPSTACDASIINVTEGIVNLSHVGRDGPMAVLLVDLRSRQIVYANPVAVQLAPGLGLPASLDEWSSAAALLDLDGIELSETNHPLSQLAEFRPVAGQGVSAARRTEMGQRREPLWVVALPLSGAPQLDGHGLVVFLPLADRQNAQAAAGAANAQAELRDRAVLATGMSFTMADATSADMPLIWVNPAFTTATGYTFEEAVGKNCRFLQGKGTNPNAHSAMRAALEAGESLDITILNYRKDGSAFWNQLSMSPIFAANGDLTHYVGIQTDVTGRIQADQERDRALASEQAARKDSELAQRQLALLAEATSKLAETLDVNESLERLSSLVVPMLADWVIIATADHNGGIGTISVRHRDKSAATTTAYATKLKATSTSQSPLQKMLTGEVGRFVNNYSSDDQREQRSKWVTDESLLDMANEFGAESVMFVPLPGRNQVDGVMVLVRGASSADYTEQDLTVAVDLGRRAGLTLENARIYQREHRIAETLQRSLLPGLPQIPNVTAAARYRASEVDAAVGGDFYELIALRNGAIGIAIGDVVGHDVLAAAAMGHLRGLLRACAWGDSTSAADAHRPVDPADVLNGVDGLLQGLGISTLATVAYACLEPRENGEWFMRYASAGHPPLLICDPEAGVKTLDGAGSTLLGVQTCKRSSKSRIVSPGTTVFAYTDGLIERRDESLTISLARLVDVIKAGPTDPEAMCDHVLQSFGETGADDVAMLALRV